MDSAFQKARLTDLIMSLKTMADDDLAGPIGEQVLMEAFPLYETFTSHFPKRSFKTFCNLTRGAIRFKKSFHPLKFQRENLGIE